MYPFNKIQCFKDRAHRRIPSYSAALPENLSTEPIEIGHSFLSSKTLNTEGAVSYENNTFKARQTKKNEHTKSHVHLPKNSHKVFNLFF